MRVALRKQLKLQSSAYRKAVIITRTRREAEAAAREIVERKPSIESEQRLESLAEQAKKARSATFLVRYRAS